MSDILKCTICGKDDFKSVRGYQMHVEACVKKQIKKAAGKGADENQSESGAKNQPGLPPGQQPQSGFMQKYDSDRFDLVEKKQPDPPPDKPPEVELNDDCSIPLSICPNEINLFPDNRLMHLRVSGKKIGERFYIDRVKVVK